MSDIGDELWAWQCQEQPDVWSLVGVMIPGLAKPGVLTHTPLIGRNRDIVEQKMEPWARRHAERTGQPLRLAHFTLAEVVTA
jgi:hypothetical protein